jgi:hypothetical protein
MDMKIARISTPWVGTEPRSVGVNHGTGHRHDRLSAPRDAAKNHEATLGPVARPRRPTT